MYKSAPEVVSIADACLGGLRGRSALLIGPTEQRYPYGQLLQRAGMKRIYQEEAPFHISHLLSQVQLLISMPAPLSTGHLTEMPVLTAANVAQGCSGRHTPLLIFDLARSSSVEELAGLLPSVCLYTPNDLQRILSKSTAKAS